MPQFGWMIMLPLQILFCIGVLASVWILAFGRNRASWIPFLPSARDAVVPALAVAGIVAYLVQALVTAAYLGAFTHFASLRVFDNPETTHLLLSGAFALVIAFPLAWLGFRYFKRG